MSVFDFFWKSSLWQALRVKFPFTLLGKVYWRFIYDYEERKIKKWCIHLNKKKPSLSCESRAYSFGEVLISLTTYPARIESAYYSILSILDQTIRPNGIILTLIKQEFPQGEEGLPQKIRSLKEKGLRILWASQNLRPHNKYFYSMQEHPSALIITIDDDNLYPKDTIEKLIKCYKKFPHAISALHTDKFSFENNQLCCYSKAIINYKKEVYKPRLDLLAEGFAGVLYPPSILPRETFNKDLILKYAPIADDIWLKCIELKNNIPVVRAAHNHNITVLTRFQESALFLQNREKKLNDKQLEATQSALKINIYSND